MIVVEMTEDKFGQAMKDIVCISEKLESLKHIFEADSIGYRNNRRYMNEDRGYRDRNDYYDENPKMLDSYRGRYM